MSRLRIAFPLLMAVAAIAAGCGGGGGTSPYVSPTSAPTATPHVGPTSIVPTSSPETVVISGANYTLGFTLPAVTAGSAATVTAALQASPPAGVPVVQARHRSIAGNPVGLVYLTLSSTATVGFSSLPSFVWTLPSAGSIPSGSYAYMAWWDPYVAQWQTHLGPGMQSGTSVVFPGVAGGITLNANTQYVYALTTTTQTVPTATPAPTPTPTIAPTGAPSSTPAYCSGYSTPVPNSNSSPQPVYFTDNSGTGAQAYLYVVTGTAPSPAPPTLQTQYLAANGTLTNFTAGATAPPIPLACFPGSTHHGTGLTFELPPPSNANQSGNLYIVYATPGPGNTLPNPLQFVGSSGGGHTQPTLDWNAAGYSSLPWDEVEYTLPYGVTDVTQVDKVGLPLQLTQGSNTVGFAQGQYESLLSSILADSTYKNLAVSGQLNGRNVLARILAPQDADNWGFPQNWWYSSTYNAAHSPSSGGYLATVLASYATAPRLYTLNGIGGQSGNYCAKYDGSANVLFYAVGSATTCSGLTSPAYTMPVSTTLSGSVNGSGAPNVDSYNVCASGIFAMPYGAGGSGTPFADETEFYLWKGMAIEIGRGVALQTSTHPIGGWNTSPPSPLQLSSYYLDPVYNTYAYLVHKNMIGNKSYALQYDEPGGLAPTITSNPAIPLQITVWNIPPFSRATPTVPVTGTGCPT